MYLEHQEKHIKLLSVTMQNRGDVIYLKLFLQTKMAELEKVKHF